MNAKDIILKRDSEFARMGSWRSLWQKAADLVFPRENQIDTSSSPGEQNATIVWDNTAQQDSKDMAAGLSVALFPTGQKAFGLRSDFESEAETSYLARATEMTHEAMFASNLMLELNETLRSLSVFGTGNLFTEWTVRDGLVYKDYDISLYHILENSDGIVDTLFLTMFFTARQAEQEFGEENLSDRIKKALEKDETKNDTFEFIHFVGPRTGRRGGLEDALNMPFESKYIDVEAMETTKEGGFEQFPYAIARWSKRSTEIFGRGQGTDNIRDIQVLQQMKKDWLELANKFNRPPLLVHNSFEGRVNLSPAAQNSVMEMDSVKALLPQLGNYPVTEKAIELQQAIIHRAFYKDIFAPLRDLTARMTTVEVAERMREGFRQLGPPVSRLQSELLDPTITRSFFLLLQNGQLPPLPESLRGKKMKIEYLGPLSLALRNQEARGFLEFAGTVGELSEVFPEARDYVGIDKALPDLARSMGVKEDHIPTQEEIAESRRVEAERMAAQQALEAGQQMADAYGKTTGAPEEGSAASKVMETVNG